MSTRLKRLEAKLKPVRTLKVYSLDKGIYTLWNSDQEVPQDEVRDSDLVVTWV